MSTTQIWHWLALGLGIFAFSYALSLASHSFTEARAFEEIPAIEFVVSMLLATGIACILVPLLIIRSTAIERKPMLAILFLIGLGARIVHLGAIPILEDDYQRYLWDGALMANALSPYLYAPLSFLNGEIEVDAYWDLAETAWPVIERINHPEYRTVYPPVAQFSFAISHWISPFSLDGWRIVLILAEVGVFAIIVRLLHLLGRNPLWAALYWWHPLVLKEVANSAHLEPVLMLFVLSALWSLMLDRHRIAAVFLALGFGVKIWPIILMAPVLYALRHDLWRACQAVFIFCAIACLMMWPVLASGLNETSGFVAFAREWAASSAAILVSEALADSVASLFGFETPKLLGRVLLGSALVVSIMLICMRQKPEPISAAQSFFAITVALFLLSPSVTPWYALWLLPFLCLFPNPALILASVLIGLHYSYFPLARAEQIELYRYGVVWLIWVPVWAMLVWDALGKRGRFAQRV